MGLAVMAAVGAVGLPSAKGAIISSTATGAYNSTNWTGGVNASASGSEPDTVTIGHDIYLAAAADATGDAISFSSGGTLEFRNDTNNTNFAVASLNLSAADTTLKVGRATSGTAIRHTLTLGNVANSLLLGSGRTTTLSVGANTTTGEYGLTIDSGATAGSTKVNGSHTFSINNNGSSTGRLQLSRAIVGTGSTQDIIYKTGAGVLILSAAPTTFTNAIGDLDRIEIQAGTLALPVTTASSLTIRFNGSGATFLPGNVTHAARFDFDTAGVLNATGVTSIGSASGDGNPNYTGIFAGNGSITIQGGQFRHDLTVSSSSTWLGNLIVGAGARGTAIINNANLNYDGTKGISLLTVRGATGFSDPALGNSASTGLVRVNANITVGGLDNTGNGVNTRIVSATNLAARVLTVDVGNSLSYTYQGSLSDGTAMVSQSDTSTLKLIKTGLGTQTISGQTYLSNYSGGTEVNGGTLIVNGGGVDLQKTSSTAIAALGNGSTSAAITVGSTSDLYVGKRLTLINGGVVANNVFISEITNATQIKITNRSGASIAAIASGNTLDFAASSPTGTGAVTVNTGGTLKGTGRIAGAVTVNAGGTFAPGTSPGIITLASDLTIAGTHEWEFDNLGAIGTAGTNYDLTSMTNASAALTIASGTLQVKLLSGDYTSAFWNTSKSWKIIDVANTGNTNTTFASITSTVGLGGEGTWSTSLGTVGDAGDVFLNWTPAGVGPASISVSPVTGSSRTHNDSVTIDATADDGTYTIGSTTVSGYGWSQSGISNGGLSGTNNDITGTVSHNTANSINGDNQGRFSFAISAASSGNGTYNYTLTNTVAGNVAPYGVLDAPGTTQIATILSGNKVEDYAVNGTRDTGLNQLGNTFTIETSEALTADTDLTMAIRRRVDGTANDEVTAGDANFARFDNASGKLYSDVVDINGIDGKLYVLTISYDEADLGGHPEDALRLGWLNTEINKWVIAVLGNTSGSYQDLGVSAWTTIGTLGAEDLGKLGVDTTNNYVWAVLNHNSQFAVIPEPTSLALLGLGAMGLLARRRQRQHRN